MPEAAQQGQSAAPAQTGAWTDPYRAYNFKLEIQGVTEGHFTECGGLGVKVDVISYREGGNSQVIHRLPGQVSYAALRADQLAPIVGMVSHFDARKG
jgi:hypothetical protein